MSSLTTSSTKTIRTKTYEGLGNLIKILPAGTFFLYRYLIPIVTNNGQCHTVNKYLTSILLAVCGLSCIFSSFTDSYVDDNGVTHVKLITKNGLWPSSSNSPKDKLQVKDFVHAFLSVLVLAVVALLDPYTVDCFYPSFEKTEREIIMMLPAIVGAVSSVISVVFPSKRQGLGHSTSKQT